MMSSIEERRRILSAKAANENRMSGVYVAGFILARAFKVLGCLGGVLYLLSLIFW